MTLLPEAPRLDVRGPGTEVRQAAKGLAPSTLPVLSSRGHASSGEREAPRPVHSGIITTRYLSPFQNAAGSLTSSLDAFEFGPASTIW